MHRSAPEFRPFRIHLLTVTDTRSPAEDGSGNYLAEALQAAGHVLHARDWCRDERYDIRAIVSAAIAEPQTDIVLITGGTGMFERDITPDAVEILFDKTIPGFGEVFRAVSLQEIGMSTIQSRAVAGIANKTLIFLPARFHRRMPHRLGENHPETIRSAHRKLWLHARVQYVGQAVKRTEVQAAFGFQAACTLCFLAQCPVLHNENANRIISIQGFEPSVELGQDTDLLLHCQPASQHRAKFFTAATAKPSFRCFPSARLRQYPSNTAQYR